MIEAYGSSHDCQKTPMLQSATAEAGCEVYLAMMIVRMCTLHQDFGANFALLLLLQPVNGVVMLPS